MPIYVFALGFLVCLAVTIGGVLIWELLDKKKVIAKETEAEDEIKRLTISEIRARNASLSLEDIVSADSKRFGTSTRNDPETK